MPNIKNSRKQKSRKSGNQTMQNSQQHTEEQLTPLQSENKTHAQSITIKRGKTNGKHSPVRKLQEVMTPDKASRKLIKMNSYNKNKMEKTHQSFEPSVESKGKASIAQGTSSFNNAMTQHPTSHPMTGLDSSHYKITQDQLLPSGNPTNIMSFSEVINPVTPQQQKSKNVNNIIFDSKQLINSSQAYTSFNNRTQERLTISQHKQNKLSMQNNQPSILLNQQIQAYPVVTVQMNPNSKINVQNAQALTSMRLDPLGGYQNDRLVNNESQIKKNPQRKLVPMSSQEQKVPQIMSGQFIPNANSTFNQDSAEKQYPTFTTKHNSVRIYDGNQEVVGRGKSSPSRNGIQIYNNNNMSDFGNQELIGSQNMNSYTFNASNRDGMINSLKTQGSQINQHTKQIQISNHKYRVMGSALNQNGTRKMSPKGPNQVLFVQGITNQNFSGEELSHQLSLTHDNTLTSSKGSGPPVVQAKPLSQSMNKQNYFFTPGPTSTKKQNLQPIRQSHAPITSNSQLSHFSSQIQEQNDPSKLPIKNLGTQLKIKQQTQNISYAHQTPIQNVFRTTANSMGISYHKTNGSIQQTNRPGNNIHLKSQIMNKQDLVYTPEKVNPYPMHVFQNSENNQAVKSYENSQTQLINGQVFRQVQGQSIVLNNSAQKSQVNQTIPQNLVGQPLYAYKDGHLVPVNGMNLMNSKPFISPTVITQLHNSQLGQSLTKLNHIQHNIQQLSEEQTKLIKTILNQQGAFRFQNEPSVVVNNDFINPMNLPQYIAGANMINDSTIKLRSLSKKQVDVYGNPIKPEKGKNKIPFENAYVQDCYKFIVTPGNNSQLIRKAMDRRHWWIEIQAVHSMYNFKWQPTSQGIKWERMGNQGPKNEVLTSAMAGPSNTKDQNSVTLGEINQRQLINHVQSHQLVTEKANLFMNMQKQADSMKENVFDFLPITFYIEMPNFQKENAYNQSMQPFIQYFQVLEENKNALRELRIKLAEINKEELKEGTDEVENNGADMSNNDTDENQASDEEVEAESPTKKDKKSCNSAALGTLYKTSAQKDNQMHHIKSTKFKQFNFEKRTNTRLSCPLSHFDGYNLWLLKPTHMNRGRGIHVFNDLQTLQKLMKEYCTGREEENIKKKYRQDKEESPQKEAVVEQQPEEIEDDIDPELGSPSKKSPNKQKAYKIKHNNFIIQKYIERPLLICNRKFDIRVWVLLDQDQNLFMFKEGYVRLSGQDYSIDLKNVDNAAVHLTNNAIQKHLDTYGLEWEGNIISYKQMQEVFDREQPDCGINVYKDLVPAMKQLIVKSFYSVRKTIDPHRKKYCFELFGYDFILDEDFNTWLIEINTNPCLEESNQLLKDYLPRMIEDMLKLTIDVIFPKNIKRKKSILHKSPVKVTSKKTKDTPSNEKPADNQDVIKHKNEQYIDSIKEENTYLQTDEDCAASNKAVSQSIEVNNNADAIKLGSTCGTFTQEQPDNQHENKEREDSANKKDQARKEKALRRIYPVDGYNDHHNMWEKLVNIDKQNMPNIDKKLGNNRHKYTISVQDRVFKIKKNPDYIFLKRDKKLQIEKQKSQKEKEAGKAEPPFSYSSLKNLTLEEKVALAKEHARAERLRKEQEDAEQQKEPGQVNEPAVFKEKQPEQLSPSM